MRLGALVASFTVAVALWSPALAQSPGRAAAQDEVPCNRSLLHRSHLFQGWLALWNEQIGELEISDFERQYVYEREAEDCGGSIYCVPLDRFRRHNRVSWMSLSKDSPDHSRSIELPMCEIDDPNALTYLDTVRNQAWEINLELHGDVAGWLGKDCFFVAGRLKWTGIPAVWLYGRSVDLDSDTALIAQGVHEASEEEIQAYDERLQPWLQKRFPAYRCSDQEFRDLVSQVWSAQKSLSKAKLETVFALILRDGEVDPAEADVLRFFFKNLEDGEIAGPLRERIDEFQRQHSDQLGARN